MWPSNVLQWINLANSSRNHLLHRHWHVYLGSKSTSKFLYSIVCAHCFLYYSKSASMVPPCLRVLYEKVWCMVIWIPFSCFSPTFYPKYYLGEPEFEDFDAESFDCVCRGHDLEYGRGFGLCYSIAWLCYKLILIHI